MKIAIVCPYNLDIPGGVQEHVMAEAAELRKRGHDVVIVTPKPRRRTKPAKKGIYFIGSMARIRTPGSTSADVSAAADRAAIQEFFDNEQPELLHVHEPEVPFMARQIIAEAKCPVVGTFHAAMPANAVGRSFINSMKPYVRTVVKLLTHTTVVSPAAMMLLDEVDLEPITIPNGVDLKKYHQKVVKRDSNTILYVGRLEKRKGIIELLQTFAILQDKKPEAKLEIAGGGPLWRKLHKLSDDLGLENVTFHGFVSDQKKRQLMASCGVFTSPALYGESFGIVLIEAMAMGAPVVAGDNPGYSTVLTDRGSISLANPMDHGQYADKLILFMEDAELVKLWQKWAKQTVKKYDWPKIIDKYEELFKELA